MKILQISDTHGKHNLSLPEADMIIHGGDFSMMGRHEETKEFLRWFNKLPYKHKVLIAGNHDWIAQKEPGALEGYINLLTDERVVYLNHASCEIEGIKIYGSPWQPWFYSWAFNYPRENGEYIWKDIPLDTNILITHGPPYGILDMVGGKEHVGCRDLLAKLNTLPNLKLHVFGHIHEARGYLDNGKTTFINASVLDDGYTYYDLKPYTFNYPE